MSMQLKFCIVLYWLGSTVQSVLKINAKMQDCREIERSSRAVKWNSTLSTSNHCSAVSSEIHLMLAINHHWSVKLTVQTQSCILNLMEKGSSLSAVSIMPVLCVEQTTNTKWQKPVLVFKHKQLLYFLPVWYNLHHDVTHLTIFPVSCHPLPIQHKIPQNTSQYLPICTVATAVQFWSKVFLVQFKSPFNPNFYYTSKL